MQKFKLSVLGLAFAGSLFGQEAIEPTWAEDIACIVYSHCTNCHNSNGVAPFALETYDDMVLYKDAILHEVVVEKLMPPWQAADPHGKFVGDYSLSDGQILAIKNWYDNGMEFGDPENLLDPPVFTQEFEIIDPDFIIDLPEFEVPPNNGTDQFRCFVIPTDFDTDVYISGIEYVPDNLTAVHHFLLFQDPGNTSTDLDAADPGPGYQCFGDIGTPVPELLSGWAPGSPASISPDGMGLKLPKGANLVVQVHYPFYSVGERDASSIRLKIREDVDREIRFVPVLNHFTSMVNGPISIQPNETKTYYQEQVINGKITLLGVAPHAHLICTSLRTWAEAPDGTITELINLPRWDFEWQGEYVFQKPIIIEPGTVIKSEGTYDNTINNPNNPNVPPQHVFVGDETGDEMMVFFFNFIGYQNGDEDLVFEDHFKNYNDCVSEAALSDTKNLEELEINIFPNPAKNFFVIDCSERILSYTLFDNLGKVVQKESSQDINRVDVSKLVEGSYYLQLKTENRYYSKKLNITK